MDQRAIPDNKRVLIVSMPRAGTTWVGQVLGRTEGACYVGEPDNERKEPYALRAKRAVGRIPVLEPHDDAPGYARLWDLAFDGMVRGRTPGERAATRLLSSVERAEIREACCGEDGACSWRVRALQSLAPEPTRRQNDPVVVTKSVYAGLSVEWMVARWAPRVVVVLRHPLNMLASWIELGYRDCRLDAHPKIRERFIDRLGIAPPNRDASTLARIAWEVGLLNTALEEAAERHPEWCVVTHEALCLEPSGEFKRLCDELELGWSRRAQDFLTESDRPGEGYLPHRRTGEQPERWRRRLDQDQVSEIGNVLERFPLRTFASETSI